MYPKCLIYIHSYELITYTLFLTNCSLLFTSYKIHKFCFIFINVFIHKNNFLPIFDFFYNYQMSWIWFGSSCFSSFEYHWYIRCTMGSVKSIDPRIDLLQQTNITRHVGNLNYVSFCVFFKRQACGGSSIMHSWVSAAHFLSTNAIRYNTYAHMISPKPFTNSSRISRLHRWTTVVSWKHVFVVRIIIPLHSLGGVR